MEEPEEELRNIRDIRQLLKALKDKRRNKVIFLNRLKEKKGKLFQDVTLGLADPEEKVKIKQEIKKLENEIEAIDKAKEIAQKEKTKLAIQYFFGGSRTGLAILRILRRPLTETLREIWFFLVCASVFFLIILIISRRLLGILVGLLFLLLFLALFGAVCWFLFNFLPEIQGAENWRVWWEHLGARRTLKWAPYAPARTDAARRLQYSKLTADIAALVRALRDPEVRNTAAPILVDIGPPALKTLRKTLAREKDNRTKSILTGIIEKIQKKT